MWLDESAVKQNWGQEEEKIGGPPQSNLNTFPLDDEPVEKPDAEEVEA